MENQKRVCGNTATGTLKWIALILMVIDHVGAGFFNGTHFMYIPELRVLGRMAFPIYAWCMAVGAEYTGNILKYIMRIGILFLISQPIYALAMEHSWTEFNIFATLFLALGGIAGMRLNRYGSRWWAPVIAVIVSFIVDVDYGWQGVLFVMLIYQCRKDKGALTAVMIAYCLFWGYTSGSSLNTFFGITLPKAVSFLPRGNKFFTSIFRMQTCAVLALPLLLIPMPDLKMKKWLGYAMYPGHLLVILLVKLCMDFI